jgi:hypothetical protein
VYDLKEAARWSQALRRRELFSDVISAGEWKRTAYNKYFFSQTDLYLMNYYPFLPKRKK